MQFFSIRFMGLVSGIALLTACGGGYQKQKSGLEYKVIDKGNGKKITYGQVVKLHFDMYYKDSLLRTSREGMPAYNPVDSTQMGPEYTIIFTKAKSGDSIVTRILTDSVYKPGQQEMPPFFKKGQYLSYRFKILGVFNERTAQSDMSKEMEAFQRQDSIRRVGQLAKDDAALQAYFGKNKISPSRMAKGTYVVVDNAGTGDSVKDGKLVSVKYTGRTLDGKTFDSNIDSSFKHTEPYQFVIGTGSVIQGWDDGLKAFRKGGSGKLFIPSALAYGNRGREPDIKPNDNLVFEVQVLDVATPPDPRQQMIEESRRRQLQGGK